MKRLFPLLLAAITLLLCLCGCGSTPAKPSSDTSAPTETGGTQPTASTTAATAATTAKGSESMSTEKTQQQTPAAEEETTQTRFSAGAVKKTEAVVTEQDLRKTEQEFARRVALVKEKTPTKATVSKVDPTGYYEYTVTDPKTIAAWVDLLGRMEMQAEPIRYVNGGGFALSLYIGDERIHLGAFSSDTIYTNMDTAARVSLRLKNWDTLYSEMESLAKLSMSDPPTSTTLYGRSN